MPSLFWHEVVNPVARQYGAQAKTPPALHDLDERTLVTIDPGSHLDAPDVDHVERFDLTAYDAHYLALATSSMASWPRWTCDSARRQARVAIGSGRHRSETPAVYEHDVTWPNYKGASAYLAKLRAEALRPTTSG